MKNTKKALTLSVLSLVLCFTMLLGTTYAWFTDSVTSGVNKIIAGNLDVDLIMWDDADTDDGYRSIANEEAAIFGNANSLVAQNNHADTLWEPGKTQIVYLGVRNNGSLALKYNVWLAVNGDLAKKLGDETVESALEYAIIDGATYAANHETLEAADWTTVKATAADTNKGDVKEGSFKAAEGGVLDEIVKGTKGETDYFVLAVHMKEDAGNAYRNKDVTIDVTVVAGQVAAESDSFDNTYDKDAKYAEYEASSGEELINTLNEINSLPGNAKAQITLSDDIDYDEATLNVTAGNEVTIDLSGHKLNVENYDGNDGITVTGGGTLTLKDSSGDHGKLVITADEAGSNAIFVYNDNPEHPSVLNIENIIIDLPDTSEIWSPNTIHAIAEDGCQAIVNVKDGAEINVAAEENAAIIVDKNAVVNMSGGTINAEYNVESQTACVYGISLKDSSAVLNFSGGTINVSGEHCASGIYSYGNASKINVTGGVFNVEGNVTTPSGYILGIEAASDCDLNVSGATFNVKSSGAKITAAAAIAVGRRVDTTIASDVTINVFKSASAKNLAIMDYTDDVDLMDPANASIFAKRTGSWNVSAVVDYNN